MALELTTLHTDESIQASIQSDGRTDMDPESDTHKNNYGGTDIQLFWEIQHPSKAKQKN